MAKTPRNTQATETPSSRPATETTQMDRSREQTSDGIRTDSTPPLHATRHALRVGSMGQELRRSLGLAALAPPARSSTQDNVTTKRPDPFFWAEKGLGLFVSTWPPAQTSKKPKKAARPFSNRAACSISLQSTITLTRAESQIPYAASGQKSRRLVRRRRCAPSSDPT